MFFDKAPNDQKKYYERMLGALGSLSGLFSDSSDPYIAYRASENLFCKAFDAENLSRGDVSIDAKKDELGIGIKTFIHGNGKTYQKIAEFNGDHQLYSGISDQLEKVQKISELRNYRIAATKRICAIEESIYHCVTRRKGHISIYELPLEEIKTDRIKLGSNGLNFTDGVHNYRFNVSKSTLYMQFPTDGELSGIEVEIWDDPYAQLEKLLASGLIPASDALEKDAVILPLYAVKKGVKYVPGKSGLNQWNAGGRKRGPKEVYIPVPAWIHKKFPGFFPAKEQPFILRLPNGKEMSAKICQAGGKALMSNPNSTLGVWLLDDVTKTPEGELATYDRLMLLGLDSVEVTKNGPLDFTIDFKTLGSFDRFEENEADDEDGIESENEDG